MNEDENKSKVVFVDLEEYKQMGKVRKDPDPVPRNTQKTAHVSEEKKENVKKEEKKPGKTDAPAGTAKPDLESPPSFESIIEEKKKISETRKAPETGKGSEVKKEPSASEKTPEKKSTAETKKPAEKPKTASASPAKKASGTYTAESGRSTKKWFYSIAGATLVFGLIVYFIWDYREKEIKENAFESVKTALDSENYDVIDSAENLIEDYPDDGRGYEYLATAYYGKGEYEKVLEVLDDGREQAEDSDYWEYSDLYSRAEIRKQYYDTMKQADEYAENGMTEEAKEGYLAAIQVEEELDDAYYALTDLYISQGEYDTAIEWLDSVETNGEFTITERSELREQCLQGRRNVIMNNLETLMKNKDYSGLQKWFSDADNRAELEIGSYEDLYYQNGSVTEEIDSGTGLILSDTELYLGEISNNQKNGTGVRFEHWNSSYSVTDSSWSNDEANGKFTYSYTNTEDKTANEVYSGTVKDNLFNGDITCRQYCNDGNIRTFYMHAENGTFDCIRVLDEGYVYGESNDNWYVYYYSEDGLKGHGV